MLKDLRYQKRIARSARIGRIVFIVMGAASCFSAAPAAADSAPAGRSAPDFYSEDKLFACIPVLHFHSLHLAHLAATDQGATPEARASIKQASEQDSAAADDFEKLAVQANPARLQEVLSRSKLEGFDNAKELPRVNLCRSRHDQWMGMKVFAMAEGNQQNVIIRPGQPYAAPLEKPPAAAASLWDRFRAWIAGWMGFSSR